MDSSKISNVLVVLTFFSLWLTGFSSDTMEQYFALGLIFSFGILHGANDISIIRKLQPVFKGRKGDLRIIAAYTGFVLLVALAFFALPLLALLFFIGISAYHFGEQHWQHKARAGAWQRMALYVSYGATILFMLFFLHGAEVSEIITAITAFSPPLWVYRAGFFSAAGVLLLSLLLNIPRDEWLRRLPFELLLLGVFYLVFANASLIWAFAIYFILWHSIPSLMDQISMLYGRYTFKNGMKYLRNSAVYWVAAMLSLVVAFFIFREGDSGFLPLFFCFLAAITFPHVLVIGRMYRT